LAQGEQRRTIGLLSVHVQPKNPNTMDMKVLLASLAAGVAGFLLGWVVYGMLLMGWMEANSNHFEGFMKAEEDMGLPWMFLGNLALGTLIAWALARMGVASAMAGIVPGAVICALMALNFDLMMYGMTNWFKGFKVLVVDVVAFTAIGAVLGAVAGLVLGFGGKPAQG